MTITYRGVKDEALTYGELDENFRDLRQDTDLERVLVNGNVANLTIVVPQVITNVSFVGGSNVTEAFIATNNYTLQVGAASNAWTNVQISLTGAAANDWSNLQIALTGAAANDWSNVQIAATGLSANNYAIQVGAASNAWSNVQIAATGLAANAYALSISTSSGSSSNSYTLEVGTAGNNYTNAVGISVGAGANVYAIAVGNAANNWSNTIGISVGAGANVYAIAVGNAANNWSNTKLSNSSITISGGLKISDIHLLSNVTVTLSSNVGNVGQISWDGDYLYVCVATNQWKRTQILSW